MSTEHPDVIVGAGLAGLCCARELQRHGRTVLIVEASDGVGGRIRTDVVDGFRCDRGFQVFLTSYPEAQRQLDYDRLQLGRFTSGALVFNGSKTHRFADPWREPQHAWSSMTAPVGTSLDRLRLAKLRRDASKICRQALTTVDDEPTIEVLRRRGFSEDMIDSFLRPFLGGIFLDRSLKTSSRMLYFVFGMFAAGDASLPALGMEAIPKQLADQMPKGVIRLQSPVAAVERNRVTLRSGEVINANRVVVATDGASVSKLLPGVLMPSIGPTTTCLYFTADADPIGEATLVLNGTTNGRVNTVVNLAAANASYSPNGSPLFSVSLVGDADETDEELAQSVTRELVSWFGESTLDWRLLKRTTVSSALPDQSAGQQKQYGPIEVNGVLACGDWTSFGSIHHAMTSGRETAARLLAEGLRVAS